MKKILLFTIMVFSLVFSQCKKAKEETFKGSLTFVIGTVEVLNNNGTNPGVKDASIEEGDTIKTGPKSVAIVQFNNQSTSIEIQENSEFSISKFNAKEQELVSTRGNFWLKAKKVNKDSNFNVVMPTSVAGIRGTSLYSFEDKEAGIHGICHCQGQVELQAKESDYKGIHDTDYAVLTKDGKTITITPEDFEAVGAKHDMIEHNHSEIDGSPLGKKSNVTNAQLMRIKQIAMKKFAEK